MENDTLPSPTVYRDGSRLGHLKVSYLLRTLLTPSGVLMSLIPFGFLTFLPAGSYMPNPPLHTPEDLSETDTGTHAGNTSADKGDTTGSTSRDRLRGLETTPMLSEVILVVDTLRE